MITLEDIARRAGVSHSTVSRALADSPLVNSKTKEFIQALAKESGYLVNQVARNLKTRSTQMIGLIVPEVSNPYYPKVIQMVADQVRAAGYSLQLHLSGANQEAEDACLNLLREHRADGILLVTAECGLVARDNVNRLAASGTPIVLMGWVEGASHLDIVSGDDSSGGYALANHLLSLGHSKIAVIGKPPHRGIYDRIFGFTKALIQAGVQIQEAYDLPASDDESVRFAVRSLLSLQDPPTAIFAYQDSLAALVYKHLENAGVLIPSQMTVVGFDDLDLASYLSPRLTTVGTHIEPLVESFVKLLLQRIQDSSKESSPKHIFVTPKLIVRASGAPPNDKTLSLKKEDHP